MRKERDAGCKNQGEPGCLSEMVAAGKTGSPEALSRQTLRQREPHKRIIQKVHKAAEGRRVPEPGRPLLSSGFMGAW